MQREAVDLVRAFFALTFIVASMTGCASIWTRTNHEDAPTLACHNHYFLGVRESADLITGEADNETERVIWMVDFPLTLALDTILLPVDLIVWPSGGNCDQERVLLSAFRDT